MAAAAIAAAAAVLAAQDAIIEEVIQLPCGVGRALHKFMGKQLLQFALLLNTPGILSASGPIRMH